MPTTSISDLRIIIGEDEQMLAIDLAQQLGALGADVVASVSSVEEFEQLASNGFQAANAAVLDIKLLDGSVLPLVPRLEEAGIAVVFCSGYHSQERPAELSHIPWIGKPARAAELAEFLRLAVDARKVQQID